MLLTRTNPTSPREEILSGVLICFLVRYGMVEIDVTEARALAERYTLVVDARGPAWGFSVVPKNMGEM